MDRNWGVISKQWLTKEAFSINNPGNEHKEMIINNAEIKKKDAIILDRRLLQTSLYDHKDRISTFSIIYGKFTYVSDKMCVCV